MTSLAHLLGMIYDLREEVERHQMLQHFIPLTIRKDSSNLSEHDDDKHEIIEKSSESVEDFKVSLDMRSFKIDDITIKAQENIIIVDARHNEREDEFGLISRQFTRKYILPDDFDTDTIESLLTDDGKLTIKTDKKMKKADIGGDRFIPIQQHASTEDELS